MGKVSIQSWLIIRASLLLQSIVAAGARPHSPCATASSEHARRVSIWWPSDETAAAKPASPESKGQRPAANIGAEALRHPVRVLQLQWSPDLPTAESAPRSRRSHESSSGGGSSGGADGDGNSASTSSAAAATAIQAPQPPPAASHPALMTVGADWVIRIWVEVVMVYPTSNEHQQGDEPCPSMSQFCLTLVIEPPSLQASHLARPGLLATWAHEPQSSGMLGGTQGASRARVRFMLPGDTVCA